MSDLHPIPWTGLARLTLGGQATEVANAMDTTAIVILVVLAAVIIILAFLYRDRIKFALKGPLGTGLDFEGHNRATGAGRVSESEPAKSATSPAAASRITTANAGGVAIGGNAEKIRTHVEQEHPPER